MKNLILRLYSPYDENHIDLSYESIKEITIGGSCDEEITFEIHVDMFTAISEALADKIIEERKETLPNNKSFEPKYNAEARALLIQSFNNPSIVEMELLTVAEFIAYVGNNDMHSDCNTFVSLIIIQKK